MSDKVDLKKIDKRGFVYVTILHTTDIETTFIVFDDGTFNLNQKTPPMEILTSDGWRKKIGAGKVTKIVEA